MREGDETMGEAGEREPVMGERRRRREQERAAALAAERAGATAPLTRRELRRRQLEEEARLEAIATGELQLGPAGTYEVRRAAREEVAGEPGPAASSSSAAEATSASSGASAVSADSGAIAASRPSRRSVRDRLDAPAPKPPAADGPAAREATATGRRPVVRTPTSVTGIRRLDASGQLTGIQPAVRPDASPEHPLTRGSTGTARTGSAQRRTIGRPTDANTGTSDPAVWDEAVTGVGEIIAVSPVSARTGSEPPQGAPSPRESAQSGADEPASPQEASSPRGPAAAQQPSPSSPEEPSPEDSVSPAQAASPQQPPSPEAAAIPAAGHEPPSDPAQDSDEPLPRPQWVAISSVSGASADEAGGSVTRRSLRRASAVSAPSAPEPAGGEESGHNPLVTVIKVVVLALVAAIIGALIWLLATEAFDDGANGAAPTTSITIDTTTEESSAS